MKVPDNSLTPATAALQRSHAASRKQPGLNCTSGLTDGQLALVSLGFASADSTNPSRNRILGCRGPAVRPVPPFYMRGLSACDSVSAGGPGVTPTDTEGCGEILGELEVTCGLLL